MRIMWKLSLTTLGCCQDIGESIDHNGHGSSMPASDRQRWVDFYKGYAWVKLPSVDANRLIGIVGANVVFGQRVRRWTHPEAWQAVVWLFPTNEGNARPEPNAQITFPANQIEDLTSLLLDASSLKYRQPLKGPPQARYGQVQGD
ncbi:hypothetical protein [Actinomadura meridiana]